jgi:hypothetical protein
MSEFTLPIPLTYSIVLPWKSRVQVEMLTL